jgi:hypothetical protein
LLVQQQQLFAGLGHAGMHGAFELGVVEGVQRLAEFEHDVIGDIHQREIERMPLRSRRRFIHSGVGALALTPLRTRPQ